MSKIERENAILRKANDSLQTTISQQVKRIKSLRTSNKEIDNEKEITDQVTSELIEKINQYEACLEELRADNENLLAQLQDRDEIIDKLEEYEETIARLEQLNESMQEACNEEINRKLLQIKEECILKDSENLRLKEKNDHLNQEICNFQREFNGLQEFINFKEEQIKSRFQDDEVCMCLQILLKELISMDK